MVPNNKMFNPIVQNISYIIKQLEKFLSVSVDVQKTNFVIGISER